MIAIVFALLAAAGNAFASVVQRYEARSTPKRDSFRLELILLLIRRPLWWAGIIGVVAGAVFQAVALSSGGLALVQPILMTELPFTLLLAAAVFHRRIGRRSILGTLGVTVGAAVLLLAVAPGGGGSSVSPWLWVVALPSTVGLIGALVVAGRAARRSARRAAVLGSATAVTFALAAALMKDAIGRLSGGPVALLTSWQLYATCVTGVTAIFLLQNAYQAGSLVASQPAITVGDALVSVLYGVALFHERLRLGIWVIPAILGLALVVAGAMELARSPLVAAVSGGTSPSGTREPARTPGAGRDDPRGL